MMFVLDQRRKANADPAGQREALLIFEGVFHVVESFLPLSFPERFWSSRLLRNSRL